MTSHSTTYKNIQIHYTQSGEGSALVLLHGFLENKEMWTFAHKAFSKSHRVISIDLLGHGKTACLTEDHSMLEMAKTVRAVCKDLNVSRAKVVGHSMGGYVALELAKNFPELVSGLSLMNSNYYEDEEDKKVLRLRANEMAKTQFESLVRMSFMNLFAPSSRNAFSDEINSVLDQALNTPISGYIKGQVGMINRKDYSNFFAELSNPKMVILGEKDPVMLAEPILDFCDKNKIKTHVLDKGHMSHIENKEGLINALKEFINS